MAPIFSREQILSSSTPPIGLVVAFSPEFAVLGHIDVPITLQNTLDKDYPLNSVSNILTPLRLGYAAAKKWPQAFSDEDKSDEAIRSLGDQCADELWPSGLDSGERTEDEAGLKRVLAIIKELEAVENANTEDDDDDDEDDADEATIELSEALVKALDLSIKLGAEGKDQLDERSQGILNTIAQRLHAGDQIEALMQSARAWPFLHKGALAKAVGVKEEKVVALGKEITEAISEWFAKGPQPGIKASSKKSIKELLTICDVKTREHWPEADDEDEDEDDLPPKPESLFAKDGAPENAIAELEKKLEVTLPEDYKEFLKVSDGFARILADDVFEAPLHKLSELKWSDAKEALTMGGDDEDEDMDDDEVPELIAGDGDDEPEAPPAKKVKMMDGNQLLAIAKKAEGERNGAGSSAAAATADDDDDDYDDEDVDEAELEAALAGFHSSLKAELLALPDEMHETYTEEHPDAVWPDIEQVIEIGRDEATSLWLLPPAQVKKAIDAYTTMYEKVDDTHKKALRWAMIGWAGSEEAFRSFDGWALVGWAGQDVAEMNVWSSFRRYLEDMAENCERIETVDNEEEAKKQNGCFAYRCT